MLSDEHVDEPETARDDSHEAVSNEMENAVVSSVVSSSHGVTP